MLSLFCKIIFISFLFFIFLGRVFASKLLYISGFLYRLNVSVLRSIRIGKLPSIYNIHLEKKEGKRFCFKRKLDISTIEHFLFSSEVLKSIYSNFFLFGFSHANKNLVCKISILISIISGGLYGV